MSEKHPLRFVPGHVAPENPGPAPRLFAFHGRELLVTESNQLPSVETIDALGIDAVRTQYLGAWDEAPCFSAELPADFKPPTGFATRDLRMLFGAFEPELHTLAGRAVQVMEWDRTHQFCGACGAPTELSTSDRSRACPDCAIPMYPRLAPAMIVAVERGDEILLGRSRNFPPGIFSVLAGFVEPGESAEEAVIREVYEETRIVVEDVRYFGSQAWPFPNSLMLGFTARYKSGSVDTDHDDEMEAANFFHVDNLPTTFPGEISISQWLLRDFVQRHSKPGP
ncbi:MAG: NAD(+) diphosphatase [Myxococcota bacterium]|nr:NAD(+) diphosphatase [Myxococcota bacterium]